MPQANYAFITSHSGRPNCPFRLFLYRQCPGGRCSGAGALKSSPTTRKCITVTYTVEHTKAGRTKKKNTTLKTLRKNALTLRFLDGKKWLRIFRNECSVECLSFFSAFFSLLNEDKTNKSDSAYSFTLASIFFSLLFISVEKLTDETEPAKIKLACCNIQKTKWDNRTATALSSPSNGTIFFRR